MTKNGITGPLILITFGILMILNNLKILPSGFFGSLWHFWPVILILSGLDIMLTYSESRSKYFLKILIGIAVVCGAVALAWIGVPQSYQPQTQAISFDDHGDDLRAAYLEGTNRFFADFSHANMSEAHLNGANFFFIDLSSANLEGAELNGSNIFFADMTNANIKNVDMDGANIFFVDLNGADLEGTDIESANLLFTTGIDG
ncbi:MAG: pentapeptide repeat-containing protein [Methanosarcinaceae archaeon]|nr:pentapeptide repeat-containing protein [Methanosarcinaceae archaeon]